MKNPSGREMLRNSLLFGVAIATAACASSGGTPAGDGAGAGTPGSGVVSALPPVPQVTGPLVPYVEYPDSLQPVAVRDSNFLFGSVGSGDATLLINGQFVPVQPNGAFLAWLPVPEAEAGDTAFYRIRVRRGEEVRTHSHPILLWRPYEGEGAVWLDSTGYREPVERWALPDERLEFRVRAAPGLDVQLDATAARYPMRAGPDGATYSARIEASALRRAACDERCGPIGGLDSLVLRLVARSRDDGTGDSDSTDIRFALPLRVLLEDSLPVVELFEPVDSIHGNNGIVVGRPLPSGTFHWRFPVGTRAEVDGRRGERLRLRLAPDLASWVRAEDASFLATDTPRPRGTVGNLRFQVEPDLIRLGIPLAAPLPLRVSEPAPDLLVLTLYGAIGNTERISYGPTDPLLRAIDWVQQPGERFELHVRLTEAVWGYRVSYDTSGAAAVLTLEIRRPPTIDRHNPLAGRRIAIDPGHPGAGAHGPTGYYEGDANLGIARQLVALLSAEGAEPILIRDDTLPLGLYERTGLAIDAGAEVFVSIHNNALPDGVRPFGREGTSTYYFHPHSRDLAASVQAGMLRSMGLRDLGYFWGDLAVARMSWMPSTLTEGAFMMMPEHEAALKTPQFQRAYALGVLQGLRAFLAARAAGGSE